jgi:hypothetical protein
MIYWIINKIIAGYIIATLAFLAISLFYKPALDRRNTFLNKSNLIIIFVLLLNFVWVIKETFQCFALENRSTSCFFLGIGTFLFAFLFHILFCFKKYRIKISITLVSILFLTIIYNYERVIIFVTNFYRDYLPSSWSTYYDYINGKGWIVVFSTFYFIICWTNFSKLKDKNGSSL